MKLSEQYSALVGALARLQRVQEGNARARKDLSAHAHERAAAANDSRRRLLPLLEDGDAAFPAQDHAHGLTQEEARLRRVGVLMDGSTSDAEEEG